MDKLAMNETLRVFSAYIAEHDEGTSLQVARDIQALNTAFRTEQPNDALEGRDASLRLYSIAYDVRFLDAARIFYEAYEMVCLILVGYVVY